MDAPKSIAEIDFANLTKRQYTSSPDCWADQVLYFLMVDRFSDGNEKGGHRDANGQPVTTGSTPLATSDDIGSVPYGQWLGEQPTAEPPRESARPSSADNLRAGVVP